MRVQTLRFLLEMPVGFGQMRLIRQHMLRQPVGVFDRRPDDLIPPQADHHPLPIHVMVSKDIGQSPEGHPETT